LHVTNPKTDHTMNTGPLLTALLLSTALAGAAHADQGQLAGSIKDPHVEMARMEKALSSQAR
jgi:hypothetical protein